MTTTINRGGVLARIIGFGVTLFVGTALFAVLCFFTVHEILSRESEEGSTIPVGTDRNTSSNNIPNTAADPKEKKPDQVDKRMELPCLFMAYSFDDKKQQAYNFQINLPDRGVTVFVRQVGDDVGNGYRIVGFNRKNENVGCFPVRGDRSELLLQRDQEPIIVVPMGKKVLLPDRK